MKTPSKKENNLKNECNLKNEDDLKNEDNLRWPQKIMMTLKMIMTYNKLGLGAELGQAQLMLISIAAKIYLKSKIIFSIL